MQVEGALDAANILKPALARGTLHCIGATTHEEYEKHMQVLHLVTLLRVMYVIHNTHPPH